MVVRVLYIAVPIVMIIATAFVVFGCLTNGGVDDATVVEEETTTVSEPVGGEETTGQYDNDPVQSTEEVTELPPTGGP